MKKYIILWNQRSHYNSFAGHHHIFFRSDFIQRRLVIYVMYVWCPRLNFSQKYSFRNFSSAFPHLSVHKWILISSTLTLSRSIKCDLLLSRRSNDFFSLPKINDVHAKKSRNLISLHTFRAQKIKLTQNYQIVWLKKRYSLQLQTGLTTIVQLSFPVLRRMSYIDYPINMTQKTQHNTKKDTAQKDTKCIHIFFFEEIFFVWKKKICVMLWCAIF